MLTYLKIKNFITISDCEIDFTNKLNVITGESGAGKSIIFNAIEHLFGKASNQGFIKTDTTSLEIEGIFKFSHSETRYIRDRIIWPGSSPARPAAAAQLPAYLLSCSVSRW